MGTAVALGGPGRFSLDHGVGDAVNRTWMAFAAFASTLGSAAYLISTGQEPASAPAEVDATESATHQTASAASEGPATESGS